jgi:hypothetical protein
MAAADRQWPLRLQLLSKACQLRPVLMSQRKVSLGERKFFKTDEM